MQENFLKKKQVFRNSIEKGGIKIGILGGGVTGNAVSRFLTKKGIEFILVDKVKNEMGGEYFSDSISFMELPPVGFFVKSPGVKPDHSLLREILAQKIPVLSEVELASFFFQGKILGITGTDGKSTTTALTAHLLSSINPRTRMGGNIGTPFIEFCEEDLDFAVLELSSYQLEDSEYLPIQSGTILNLAEDHLERHKTMENYKNAKLKIFDPFASEYTFVLNQRQKDILGVDKNSVQGKVLYFGFSKGTDAFIDSDNKKIITKKMEYSCKDFALAGNHNLENLAASILLVESVAQKANSIESSISSFKGLSHRFQKFHTWNHVTFINDSKSTNLHSMLSGLKGFSKNDKILLILGGIPKKEDYNELYKKVKEILPIVFLFGNARAIWHGELSIILGHKLFTFDNLEQIFSNLKEMILKDSIRFVIFSPAGASFDLYKNFEERGNHFMNLVQKFFD